jgi:hypothetical protein
MSTFIETYTGITFDPISPSWPSICIEDIAHALSNQGRFTGHSRHFYSVAEHSVRVSEAVPECDALWGLLHDASEAYLVDIPRPLKYSKDFASYLDIEVRLMAAVCRRFSLPETQPESVHVADDVLLATEVRDLMHAKRAYWKKIKGTPLPGRIRPWSPAVAEDELLRRYRELVGIGVYEYDRKQNDKSRSSPRTRPT